jgi:hypothetical protein
MKAASNIGAPGVLGLIVRHEAWCGMAYGEGRACVCNPTTELVDTDILAATMVRDFKNRAQRRAMAKAMRRAKP